jgi:hypothetical protein
LDAVDDGEVNGRVDGPGDVMSTLKGGPGYGGEVKTGGGSGGRILRRIELVRGYFSVSHTSEPSPMGLEYYILAIVNA